MDDGYFPLARTAVLTLAKTKLSGAQRSIVDVIFAQTYGYADASSPHQQQVKKRRTRAPIAYEYFSAATWMGRTEVSRAINALINWRIIGRDKNAVPYTYWFNVQVDNWSPDCWRVSRIVNSEQDCEPVNRIATMKQDCELVNRIATVKQDGQPVNRIATVQQDSQPGVNRIATMKQVSALEPQGVPGTLNKNINKININNNNNNYDHDHSNSELSTLFASELGRPLSSYEINQLDSWHKIIPAELLTEALNKAVLQGKATFAYINAILQDWQNNNVSTLAEVKKHDVAFKNQKGRMIRGPTVTTAQPRNAGGPPAGVPEHGTKRPPSAYDSIDFSKFEFPG